MRDHYQLQLGKGFLPRLVCKPGLSLLFLEVFHFLSWELTVSEALTVIETCSGSFFSYIFCLGANHLSNKNKCLYLFSLVSQTNSSCASVSFACAAIASLNNTFYFLGRYHLLTYNVHVPMVA